MLRGHGHYQIDWLSNPLKEGGESMDKLYVGVDVSSENNVVHIMLPDGSKHSNFSV